MAEWNLFDWFLVYYLSNEANRSKKKLFVNEISSALAPKKHAKQTSLFLFAFLCPLDYL